MEYIISQLFNGIILGLLYVLVALGLTLILGVMEVINFVHAVLFTFGAQGLHSGLQHRLVHWSATNTSPAERRLLINAYGAADTVSLMADTTGSPLYGRRDAAAAGLQGG